MILTCANRALGGFELLSGDTELVRKCDYILSIVPPRDAHIIAQRLKIAAFTLDSMKVHCLDLNSAFPTSSN